jgi:hypothetical protein
MKPPFKNSINNFAPGFLMLMAMFLFGFGCNSSKPGPDPLVGFHVSYLQNLDSNKTITDDYKNYLHTLSPEDQKFAGPIFYYEDGTGQHAVRIEIEYGGTIWEHVLIYDKDNTRIKTIKFYNGRYQS